MPLSKFLSEERLQEILGNFGQLKVAVIGDLALDIYWYADMTRAFLSRETPLHARPVVREAFSPGAGANVAHNLKTLGVGEVSVFSVLGKDWRQTLLSEVLTSFDIIAKHLIASPQRNTTAFIKPMLLGYDSEQEDARIDFENDQPLPADLETQLIDLIQQHLPALDALLIADQLDVHGIITARIREALNRLAGEHVNKIFVVDSRRRIGLFENMTLKPNWVEAALATDPDRDPRTLKPDELDRIGKTLTEKTGRPAFITLSERGVLVCTEDEQQPIPAAPTQPPHDPVGAGDTFISALAATLAAKASPWEAGAIANLAAAVIVEKLNQTGTASPDEILARYQMATQTKDKQV